jgi:hypothetical protein
MPFTSVVSPAEGMMVEDLLVLLLGLLLLSCLVCCCCPVLPDCADTQLGVHRRAKHKQQTPSLLRNPAMLLMHSLKARRSRTRESFPSSCSTTRAFLHDQKPALTPQPATRKNVFITFSTCARLSETAGVPLNYSNIDS